MHRFRIFALALGVCLLSSSPSTLRGEEFDLASLQAQIQKTIDEVRPAVVRITGRGSAFSGVIISPEGHVLSAAHAVAPGGRYQILLPNGKRMRGTGKGSNSKTDAALIMLDRPGNDLPFVPMGDSSSLVTDQPVLGLSHPGGQKAGSEPVARFGHIVGTSRNGMLQSTALMEPGDSGGPLFDLNGSVIGIHSRIGTDMARNYEVPVNTFRKTWNELNEEKRFDRSGPPTPKLGISCKPVSGDGLRIVRVQRTKGLAAKAGLKKDDVLLKLFGREVDSFSLLTKALNAARDDGAESIKVVVKRDDETLELDMPFDVERQGAPEVALPENDRPDVPKAQGFKELRRLAKQLSELESKLDDVCVEVISDGGDEKSRSITGILVRSTPWVVSKSSVVGTNPKLKIDGKSTPLTIVKRDKKNDLVLLKAANENTVGIELDAVIAEPTVGTFLISPDADSPGTVSLLSTPAFRSSKQQSGGFLGVFPATVGRSEGVRLDRVERNSAAKRAGLLVGDVITKLDDVDIGSQQDLRSFLAEADPDAVITATFRRDADELTKTITLGKRPTSTNHAADRMSKSGRRDGFQQVLSHDADLPPKECGGPLFDLEGNFVGLNIARNSRVRCYALPASMLLDFVRDAEAEPTDSKPAIEAQ